MHPTAFGTAAVNDPNFVSDLEDGRSCSLRLVSRVTNFIDTHKPKKKGTRQ
jgi:hypothetical protein